MLGIFLMGALLACAPEKATIPPTSAGEPIRSAPAAKEGWEAEWEKALIDSLPGLYRDKWYNIF